MLGRRNGAPMKWNSSTSSAKGASLSSNRVGHVVQTVEKENKLLLPVWIFSDPLFSLPVQRLWNTRASAGKLCRRALKARCRGTWSRCSSPSVSQKIHIRQAETKLGNLPTWTVKGFIERLLLFPVKCVNSVPAYFAELLYKSMKVNKQFFSRLPRPFEAVVIILNTDLKGFWYLQQSINVRVLSSGLRNRWVDSDQNHGDSVWARPAGHQGGVQEAVRVLAAQRHQGEQAFDLPGGGGELWAAASTVLTRV